MRDALVSMSARVASAHLKRAGGSDFYNFVRGHDAQRAFNEAVVDAEDAHRSNWESENSDEDGEIEGEYEGGYTGTIAEKDSFVMRAGPMTRQEASAFANKDVNNNDKWEPAFCIPVIEGSSKHPVGFLFYGIASS